MWTNNFKECCEDLIQAKKLKSMKNYSSPKDVNFVLTESDNGMLCNIKNMKMVTVLHTTNMVLFDEKDKLQKYQTVDHIISSFCLVRYKFYTLRKNHQVKTLEKTVKYLENKMKFINGVINKKIKIMNTSEESVTSQIESLQIDKENDSYDYLMRLQVRTFTTEKVEMLEKEIVNMKSSLETLKATSETKMWLSDINDFEKQYQKFLKSV